ncbi:MAG: helix-turn-helix domain-containing protein [Ancrocorticia sp.]
MALSEFSLYLANRIQEKGTVPIAFLAERYGKSPSTVRRCIADLNEFLPPPKRFVTTDAAVVSRAHYPDLVALIQSLRISDYVTTVPERLDYLLALSLTEEFINFSSMYDALAISQSTRKKDRSSLARMLESLGFSMTSFPAKGVRIQGREDRYRIRLSEIFAQVIEIDHDDRVVPRLANNPLQQLIYEEIELCVRRFGPALASLVAMLREYRIKLSYSSKKLLYVYYVVACYRASLGYGLAGIELPRTASYPIFVDDGEAGASENLLANALLASLDSSSELEIAHSEQIWGMCERFVDAVEARIVTTFYSKRALVREIYRYISKLSIRRALRYDFYDNKLDDVAAELSFLFEQVGRAYSEHLECFMTLTQAQLSTLTLILRKHVLANKIAGRNTKKVVLISNSAIEKTGFFAELLQYHFDVEVVATLNIAELHVLHDLDFEELICFSNRIAKSLHDLGFHCIKVPYFLHHEDIDYLLGLGFSSNSHRKLLASEFTRRFAEDNPPDIEDYLRRTYPNIFI